MQLYAAKHSFDLTPGLVQGFFCPGSRLGVVPLQGKGHTEGCRGPVIGHVSPEAAAGGPIALVEEGDIIELDVEARRLEITGVKGQHKTPEEMDAILAERKANWKGFTSKYTHGLLKLYSQHAVSAMKGAYME